MIKIRLNKRAPSQWAGSSSNGKTILIFGLKPQGFRAVIGLSNRVSFGASVVARQSGATYRLILNQKREPIELQIS